MNFESDRNVPVDIGVFCEALFGFVRNFGLHRDNETPCGSPMSVSEAHALTELLGGPLAPSVLADRLCLSRSTVSRLIEKLQERGRILRRRDPTDGRATQIHLSAEGRRAAERVLVSRHARLTRLISNIDASSRSDVVRALQLLAEASKHD